MVTFYGSRIPPLRNRVDGTTLGGRVTDFYHDNSKSAHLLRKVSARPRAIVSAQSSIYGRVGKRAFDLILVCLSAPLVVILVGFLALLIARDGGRPFYTQTRVGKDGRFFKMWKLRSMVPNADQKLESYLECNPAARAEWNKTQKLENDPRVTPFGRFLRKSSMDELPQLWNVVVGDMSLVGPRPMMPAQMGLYPGHEYYDLRPGISGNWQVSARNSCSFVERAAYDTTYSRTLSLKEDCRILARTVHVVLRATGH